MSDPWALRSPNQQEVVHVAAKARQRRHLMIGLSGSHAYGYPSPDSDIDLACVHLAPSAELSGLRPVGQPIACTETIDDVKIDFNSCELEDALRSAIAGINYERILGALPLGGDVKLFAEAREVVAPLLCKRAASYYRHVDAHVPDFRGRPTVRQALYVLRVTSTYRHLLATGELVTDLTKLGALVPPETSELIALRARGKPAQIKPSDVDVWADRLGAAVDGVKNALLTWVLPEVPPAAAVKAAKQWLFEIRRSQL